MHKIEAEELCNMLASNHHYMNTSNVFDCMKVSKLYPSKYYSELFKKYINMTPLKIIISQDYFGAVTISDYILEHYDAKYSEIVDFIPTNNMIKYNHSYNINNPFLDVDIKLIKNLDTYMKPVLIHTRQWYGGCSKYGEPLVFLLIQLTNEKYYENPRNYLLSIISCNIFNFLIKVKLNKPLELPYNISFDTKSSLRSINITINGLNDVSKIKLLLNELYEFMYNIDKMWICSDMYIENLLISMKDSYQNIDFMNPSEYSSYIMKTKFFKNEYNHIVLLEELKNINKINIIKFMKELLEDSAMTTFVYGNIKKEEYTNIFSQFKTLYKNKLGDLLELNTIKDINMIHPNKMEKSNCITYYYMLGKYTKKKYLIVNLIVSILSSDFFDILRTKKQLGYLVHMTDINIMDNIFIMQKVQSDKDVKIVENEIVEFNKTIVTIINNADFNVYVDTMIKQLKEKDNSMIDRINRYLPEILMRKFIFNRNKKLLKLVKYIKKSDLIETVNSMMGRIVRVVVKGN
jgi:secreted Zn-dependent insulinase-like peptidase